MIGHFVQILILKENAAKLIKIMLNTYPQAIIMLDIQSTYKEAALKIFGQDQLVTSNSYTSTNGSSMIIMLFKTYSIRNRVL